MDGMWNAGLLREGTQQAELSKHRMLRVNLSTLGTVEPGDASGSASLDPALTTGPDLGPHFVLSSTTPDNSHCYGFEFVLSTYYLNPKATGPYTVTVWELIGNSVMQDQTSAILPIWAAMAPVTVNDNELWHSFDVNACAIRFQIVDALEDQTASRSVIIALAEL